jgi:hypothetical protein
MVLIVLASQTTFLRFGIFLLCNKLSLAPPPPTHTRTSSRSRWEVQKVAGARVDKS